MRGPTEGSDLEVDGAVPLGEEAAVLVDGALNLGFIPGPGSTQRAPWGELLPSSAGRHGGLQTTPAPPHSRPQARAGEPDTLGLGPSLCHCHRKILNFPLSLFLSICKRRITTMGLFEVTVLGTVSSTQ